jgi:hypothetical protein
MASPERPAKWLSIKRPQTLSVVLARISTCRQTTAACVSLSNIYNVKDRYRADRAGRGNNLTSSFGGGAYVVKRQIRVNRFSSFSTAPFPAVSIEDNKTQPIAREGNPSVLSKSEEALSYSHLPSPSSVN